MKNETTSKRVAKIAGKVLAALANKEESNYAWENIFVWCMINRDDHHHICTVAELKALAASCLTQVADQKR